MHLSNYYQPNVQCYVIRILWMVPIYSIESWLCLRFHRFAIYIETLRDCYESFVLYSFLQFLIEVLGGEETLVLTLKDKSPTRGMHMWGMQWCVRPWLMGQPVSRITSYEYLPGAAASQQQPGAGVDSVLGVDGGLTALPPPPGLAGSLRSVKRVQWTSPFLTQCKYGVLQYVLLKFICSLFAMILESYGFYKEGDFTPKGGYLYICFLTNLSQCWALYCLIFFYNATKNELGPIRPVGKFLSVKALVFFTWWQSVGISILFQMGMIPHYTDADKGREWSAEDVAKGLQDYLICIEMFIGAIIHVFVFPHTDYLQPLSITAASGGGLAGNAKRLGRKGRHWNAALAHQYYRGGGDDRSAYSKDSSANKSGGGNYNPDVENGSAPAVAAVPALRQSGSLMMKQMVQANNSGAGRIEEERVEEMSANSASQGGDEGGCGARQPQSQQRYPADEEDGGTGVISPIPTPAQEQQLLLQDVAPPKPASFVRAFLDSTIPRDVIGQSVGIVKGDFNVEKKTLLHHATTSDEYDLFSKRRKNPRAPAPQKTLANRGRAGATAVKVAAVGLAPAPAKGTPISKSAKEQD